MLILNQEQLKFADRYTIDNEPIASIDLMERASKACVAEITTHINGEVLVFCGKGNNGGDGLAITRLLIEHGFTCNAIVVHQSETFSNDALINYNRLKENYPNCITDIHDEKDLETLSFSANSLIIDALFGTGLNKALTGLSAASVNTMNKSNCRIISIDCPSGLYVDKENADDDVVVRSMLTLTFQYPKLSFLFAQNEKYVPAFDILDIGLHPNLESLIQTSNVFVTRGLIKQIVKKRTKFSHKGHYGHALIIAGSDGMKGAALLSTKSCLRSGAGLTTLHSAASVLEALSPYAPEAMSSKDQHQQHVTELPTLEKYTSVGIGPGIGTHPDTVQVLKKLLHYHNGTPIVLDADALNILSENKTWLSFLPAETILTPHPKEFDRLSEKHHSDFERWLAAKQFAVKHNCILVLKGAYSVVCMPDGSCYFNSSGNAGMAKGGSGDVLTGIITGLLARGYSAPKSALIGVFVHGYAADLAVKHTSMESLLADDVIEHLGKAFSQLEV
jgi:ADP-dependent NAD(P)H-hydrate dehydratase / NAD(P)H-hydrate epimerase